MIIRINDFKNHINWYLISNNVMFVLKLTM
jgi:hypothetical protein